jgi:hypothetical protein
MMPCMYGNYDAARRKNDLLGSSVLYYQLTRCDQKDPDSNVTIFNVHTVQLKVCLTNCLLTVSAL